MRNVLYSIKLVFSSFIFILFSSQVYAGTISIPAWVSNNDVTIGSLETQRTTIQNWANGNVEGGTNIKAGSLVSPDFATSVSIVKFRDEAFNDFTISGMLPVTDATLTSNISAGISYVNGVRIETAATAKTYTASKDTYVYITAGGTFNFQEVANGASAPSTPANNLLLAKAVTSGIAITSVSDLRTLSIQITANSSNFALDYRDQAIVSPDSTTAVHLEPGQIAIGTTLYTTTSDSSSLSTATAANWIEGNAPNLNNLRFYVYAYNNSGTTFSFKYASADPVNSDTSSGTGGTLRYYTTGGTTYRALAWISADSTGAINSWNYSNFPDKGILNQVVRQTGALATGTTAIPFDDTIPQITEGDEYLNVPFYTANANSTLNFHVSANIGNSGAAWKTMALFQNTTANTLGSNVMRDASGVEQFVTLDFSRKANVAGLNVYRLRIGGDGGTTTINGNGGARTDGGVLVTSLQVTEVEN